MDFWYWKALGVNPEIVFGVLFWGGIAFSFWFPKIAEKMGGNSQRARELRNRAVGVALRRGLRFGVYFLIPFGLGFSALVAGLGLLDAPQALREGRIGEVLFVVAVFVAFGGAFGGICYAGLKDLVEKTKVESDLNR